MRKHLVFSITVGLLFCILLCHCENEKKEARLRLKFPAGQVLQWQMNHKIHVTVYEDDSLVHEEDIHRENLAKEEVVEVLDSTSSRLRGISYYNVKKPDKDDSTRMIEVRDSSIVYYVQDDRGVNHEINFEDPEDSSMSTYNLRLYEQLAPRYPDEPVTPGYSWSNTVKVMLENGEINNATMNFKVKAFVREAGYDCAVVEFKGNTVVPYSYVDDSGVQEIRVDRKNLEGVFYLAYREGIIIREDEKYTLNAEGVKIVEGKEIPLRIIKDGNFSYFLTKAEGTL